MPKRLSTALGLAAEKLKEKGVFDTMIDFDSRLHIDPALIDKSTIPEFKNANTKLAAYFADILLLIKNSKKIGDAFWRTALKKLTFGEGLNTGLGYSNNGTRGSGIGREMAQRILLTVRDVVKAGTSDPKIFELVPVIEDSIGADRISDMISIILKDEFLAYTCRIAAELNVEPPKDGKDQPIVFVPKALLSDLPVVEQWEDIPIVAEYNSDLRASLNKVIGITWKKAVSDFKKTELKEILLSNPRALREFLQLYKNRVGNGYNFEVDHKGITVWDVLGLETAKTYPIELKKAALTSSDDVLKVVTTIVGQFKKLIEFNGLVYHIYDQRGKIRPERFAQYLFYAISDSYCSANGLDLNREINGGSGSLDFKLSYGLAKVNLEIKYSSNPKLVEGFEKQLHTYNMSEGVKPNHSIYLVLRINDKQDNKIKKIKSIIVERKKSKRPTSEMIVVDGIIKPSASKR